MISLSILISCYYCYYSPYQYYYYQYYYHYSLCITIITNCVVLILLFTVLSFYRCYSISIHSFVRYNFVIDTIVSLSRSLVLTFNYLVFPKPPRGIAFDLHAMSKSRPRLDRASSDEGARARDVSHETRNNLQISPAITKSGPIK